MNSKLVLAAIFFAMTFFMAQPVNSLELTVRVEIDVIDYRTDYRIGHRFNECLVGFHTIREVSDANYFYASCNKLDNYEELPPPIPHMEGGVEGNGGFPTMDEVGINSPEWQDWQQCVQVEYRTAFQGGELKQYIRYDCNASQWIKIHEDGFEK